MLLTEKQLYFRPSVLLVPVMNLPVLPETMVGLVSVVLPTSLTVCGAFAMSCWLCSFRFCEWSNISKVVGFFVTPTTAEIDELFFGSCVDWVCCGEVAFDGNLCV